MPDITVLGDFVVSPDYDSDAALLECIDEVRQEFVDRLASIDAITDRTMQLICMFSMIDRLAQEWANYPTRDSKETFCQFVLEHQRAFDYLEQVEPVTLYYRVEDMIDESPMLPGFPPEKEVSLESMGYLDSRLVKNILHYKKSDEIVEYIQQKRGEAFAMQKAKEHRLIELIYRMRSKATHEMTRLGQELNSKKPYRLTEPYYRDVSRLYVQNGKVVSDNICELVIPNAFIRTLLTDCMDGYLAACLVQKREPFSNNPMTRKHWLSWYDK